MIESFELDGQRYTGTLVEGGWCMWMRGDGSEKGGVAVAMPAPGGLDEDHRTAYALRVVANIEGRCPACQSDEMVFDAPTKPKRMKGALLHEPGCIVGDDYWSKKGGG